MTAKIQKLLEEWAERPTADQGTRRAATLARPL
jgi:hypothetical protein